MADTEVKTKEKIVQKVIEEEMKSSYLDYSMSVIVGRALPDVRDGLKPVHRRILYAMQQMGMFHNKPFKKCARIVGDCLGKFHPHGDVAVYDALVRMVQPFSLRYPLIRGQGNFGCFTGDTKVKLTDGRDLSFKGLIKEYKQGKKNYTYTINSKGLIEIAEIKNPRLTKKKEKIMKVVLDNGEEIRCTLDHRFMLRNGSYREAQKLKEGDSLMPIHLRSSIEEDNNHKIVRTEILEEREDVYDLTIEGTHNFALACGVFVHNSVDGDSAAAMRYTEAKLAKLSEEMLQDIEKKTVKFVPNFDASLKEPLFLPAKLPNLLINGSSGIAVGMATNIPPHNLIEVADASIHLIDNPGSGVGELMGFVKGPDFPTAGIISGKGGIRDAYVGGRGRITVKARASVEEGKVRKRIIVSEIPYMVNKSLLLKEIADLVRGKKISGIYDLRDESDREGMRIVISLKKEVNPEVVLNQLFKHTRLRTTFGVIMLALVDGQPKILNLKELVQHYIDHRRGVVRKRTEFDLDNASKRAHILEGLLVALDKIDETVAFIKKSKSVEDARKVLISRLEITKEQAQAILDMKLQRLTGLEQEKIKKEHTELLKLIEELKAILANESKILEIIKKELIELKERYGDERRTEIIEEEEEELAPEALIEPENMVISVTHSGYIKRQPIDTYKRQKRGGKGIIAAGTKEEDFVEDLFIANTHSYVLFFTDRGRVRWLKVYEIPEASRQSRGTAIVNLLKLGEGEKVTAFVPVKEFKQGYLFMITKKGVVKKTPVSVFSKPRRSGIIALTLDEGDRLIKVKLTDGNQNLILGTRDGMAIRFNEKSVRPMGRTARGVKGIKLRQGDEVVGAVIARDEEALLTVAERGYGKRTPIRHYRLTGRAGIGVRNMNCTEKTGKVVAIKSVIDEDELMLISQKGIGIRVGAKDVSIIGRATQGVRVMKLKEGDKVGAVAKIVKE